MVGVCRTSYQYWRGVYGSTSTEYRDVRQILAGMVKIVGHLVGEGSKFLTRYPDGHWQTWSKTCRTSYQ